MSVLTKFVVVKIRCNDTNVIDWEKDLNVFWWILIFCFITS